MSDIVEADSDNNFKEAVKWTLPEIMGAKNTRSKPEKKIDIDDVKLFETRIRKQIEDIKNEERRPTHLTVKQIEDIQKLAYDEAYKEAYKEAYDKGIKDSAEYIESQLVEERNALVEERKTLNENARQLQQCFNSLTKPVKDVDEEVEQQLTDMVFSFCKHILSHELSHDPAHILRLIKESIVNLPIAQRRISIKLNPADVKLLEESEHEFIDEDWKIEADETMSVGGCLIQTEASSIDVNIDDRLKSMTRQLYSGLKIPTDENISLASDSENSLDVDIESNLNSEIDDE